MGLNHVFCFTTVLVCTRLLYLLGFWSIYDSRAVLLLCDIRQ